MFTSPNSAPINGHEIFYGCSHQAAKENLQCFNSTVALPLPSIRFFASISGYPIHPWGEQSQCVTTAAPVLAERAIVVVVHSSAGSSAPSQHNVCSRVGRGPLQHRRRGSRDVAQMWSLSSVIMQIMNNLALNVKWCHLLERFRWTLWHSLRSSRGPVVKCCFILQVRSRIGFIHKSGFLPQKWNACNNIEFYGDLGIFHCNEYCLTFCSWSFA